MTAHDPDWISQTLDRFERPLLLYARRMTGGDAELARDVVQETFLRFLKQPRDAIEERLAQWLYTVCRNRALDVMKRERTMTRLQQRVTPREPDAGPTAAIEQREEGARMIALLDTLPDKQQEALRLRFQGGLSYKEIAAVTGESIGNVGYYIHVGLKRLRGAGAEGTVTS